MTKERIEMIREGVIPFVKRKLLEINYEGLGKSDSEVFEKDLNEVLDLAIKALEQQPSDDCVSRKVVAEIINTQRFGIHPISMGIIKEKIEALPPVTSTHGTCKYCKHCCFITGTKNRVCEKHGCMQVSNNWYCKDFEKRGEEND